jgi:hypothetical protein
MQTKYLRGRDVDARYDICARTRKNWVTQGLLPKPVISARVHGGED